MRTLGYLCPACGKAVTGARSVFALEASGGEVECACGGSTLQVRFDGERYRLAVPCGLCGGTHSAVCPPERMLRGNTALACRQTGQFCCFIGSQAVAEEQLAALQTERQQSEPAVWDSLILREVLEELRDIAARPEGITCGCGSGRYGMEVRHFGVDLICRDCGAKLRVPAVSDRDLDDLCCRMKLVLPGKKPD